MSVAAAPPETPPTLPRDVLLLILSHLTLAELIPFRFVKALRSAPRVHTKLNWDARLSGLITARTTRAFFLWTLANLRLDAPRAQPLVCKALATHGHLELMQYVRSLSPPFRWDDATALAAAGGGHLAALKWLHDNGLPCTALAARSQGAKCDRLEVFLWGLRNDDIPTVNDYDLALAARSPAVLAWLIQRRRPTSDVVHRAANGGSVACMELLLARAPDLVHQNATAALQSALRDNMSELRRWLLARLPPAVVQATLASALQSVASHRGAAALAELEADGLALDFSTIVCESARDLDTVKFLRARGAPWGRSFYAWASHRSMERVQWAFDNGCPVTADALHEVGQEDSIYGTETYNFLLARFHGQR